MNSRGATKSLESTLFGARCIVHDKLDENTSQKLRFLSVQQYGKVSHTLRDARLVKSICVNRTLAIQNVKGKEQKIPEAQRCFKSTINRFGLA
jgi:hypothetical protein